MGRPQLTADDLALQFTASQRPKLLRTLERLSLDSEIEEIADISQLVLTSEGRVASGLQYSRSAFRQVCNIAARGLHSLVHDVSGERDGDALREEVSFEQARRIFNQVMQLRRGRFEGTLRLMFDRQRRVIDGVLGPQFMPIPHLEVFTQAEDLAKQMAVPCDFAWASITGRSVVTRYYTRSPYFTIRNAPEASTYRVGLHTVNADVGAQVSFRLAVPLLCDEDETSSLGPYLGRQYHTGTTLLRRVAHSFELALTTLPQPAKYVAYFERLVRTTISMGKQYTEKRRERIDELVQRLRDAGVSKTTADHVIQSLLAGNGDFVADDDGVRSAAALYSALCQAALTLNVLQREPTEQAAYRLLIGKLKL